jgi:hypothetical protein
MDAMRPPIQEEIHFDFDVRCLVCLTRLATCYEPLAIHMITQISVIRAVSQSEDHRARRTIARQNKKREESGYGVYQVRL